MSQEGAACAVQTVCELLCEEFERYSTTATAHELRTELLTVVRDGIVRRAQQLGVHYSALACTLLAVAVKGDRYLLFHLGDGVIGYQKNGKLLVASSPDNGEFVNTTVFVTSSRALASARVMRGSQLAMEGFLVILAQQRPCFLFGHFSLLLSRSVCYDNYYNFLTAGCKRDLRAAAGCGRIELEDKSAGAILCAHKGG